MNAMSDEPVPSASEKPRNRAVMTRRSMLVGGALAAASGVAYARQPEITNTQVDSDEFDQWLPPTFGNWEVISTSGVVLPPPDSLRDRLYDNLATRVYAAPNLAPVMILLAYNNAQDGVLQVHRPEVCYPVGGYELSETEKIPLQTLGRQVPSNFFTAKSTNREEQVLYFTRLGKDYPRSWVEQRLAVIRANLVGEIPDGMLMRFSVLSPDRDSALTDLRAFADQFMAASPPQLQKLLVA